MHSTCIAITLVSKNKTVRIFVVYENYGLLKHENWCSYVWLQIKLRQMHWFYRIKVVNSLPSLPPMHQFCSTDQNTNMKAPQNVM